jgi:hypothetical protein
MPGDGSATEQAIADQIAECMFRAGFEFFPEVDDLPNVQTGLFGAPPADGSGYGIVLPVLGLVDAQFAPDPSPNAEYLQSLTPDGREAYQDAMFGDETGPGCVGEAYGAVTGQGTIEPDDLQRAFEQQLVVDALVRQDPDYVAAEAAWVRCMATDGFEFANRESIIEFLESERDRILEPAVEDVIETGSDVERRIGEDLVDLLDQEHRIAERDARCFAENLTGVIDELRQRYAESTGGVSG